jgi:hypothetical protein
MFGAGICRKEMKEEEEENQSFFFLFHLGFRVLTLNQITKTWCLFSFQKLGPCLVFPRMVIILAPMTSQIQLSQSSPHV